MDTILVQSLVLSFLYCAVYSNQTKNLKLPDVIFEPFLGKKDMQITQIECENKVLKKMIRKYEDLVQGLRMTVS